MDLQIPMNYMYGLVPPDTHKELDEIIKAAKKDPVTAYLNYNEQVARAIAGGLSSMKPIEVGVMFYLWGVICSAASHDPSIISASQAVRELSKIREDMKDKLAKEFESRFDAIKEKILSKQENTPEEAKLDAEAKVIFGRFKNPNPESTH